MPRKKPAPNDKPKARKKPGKQSSQSTLGLFFRFLMSTPIRQLILTVIVVVLLTVFWDNIQNAFEGLRELFGWGVLFIFAAIITIIAMLWRRKLDSFIFHWNRWLGGIAFVLAVWGILAAINNAGGSMVKGMGGSFGRDIIDFPNYNFIYALRIIALMIIGILLVAPRPSSRVVNRFFVWVGEQFKRQPAPHRTARPEAKQPAHRILHPRAPVEEKPPLPRVMQEPLVPPEVVSSRKKLEELAEKAAALKPGATRPAEAEPPPRQELRQVAEDVWKKYGQSAELVVVDGWSLPPIDILDTSPEVQFSQADNLQRAKLIEETLASYGVEAKVVQINAGPTVTQFGVEPGWDRKYREIKERDRDGNVQIRLDEVSKTRVKVERINSLSNDLALALAAPTIRIEAPVPGKSFIGIEVPNTTSDMVSLRGVVETSVFQKLEARTSMTLALGKGAGGEAIAADLTKMPHLLIAGATGSGKTVCLNTIICCLLMHNTPNDVRFILIDPKRVELTQYTSIPHLATPVIVDTAKALAALRWLMQEMDQRYQKLAAAGARHIEGYNKTKHGAEKLPYLVLLIDELADLMMAGFDEVETSLCRLAQLARATGIHLVVATQRPSVDVVTGLIKANFPTRISFAVTSQVDSRTILDGAGAEKLLGRGDMLFMPTEAAKPKRLQGCFLSDAEIDRLVYFWASQQRGEPDRLRMETLVATAPTGTIGGHPLDPLLEQAKELARQHENISTSFLQRRLHIGYPRAARLMEQLEAVLQQESEETKKDNGEEDTDILA
ncbi:MAG TPA: DNA translocase FtsK [Dehalococcoidales bacterium]|nr:DNA translocase FtsK [Dehalococcoidales bacterium]